MFEIKGFQNLERQLREAQEAVSSIDGDLGQIQFQPQDQASVDTAVAEMESLIDSRLAKFSGNLLVEQLSSKLKSHYRDRILELALGRRIDGTMTDPQGTEDLIRQLENTLTDLRRSDRASFHRHLDKIVRLLHSEDLSATTISLADGVNLDEWLAESRRTEGSMVGSASLVWPGDTRKELGLVIKLLERLSEKPDEVFQFSHTFCYNGNNIVANLHNFAEQILVPFVRDYVQAVRSSAPHRRNMKPLFNPLVRKAFVVHGHDVAARESVARFLHQVGMEPIILHEQASQGRTIIEKIEANSEVGFAIILLTPDDEGGPAGGPVKPRARQNVVLELGYFIGLLGRDRVCALRRGEVEIPSDIHGVVYEEFNESGAWKTALGKELHAAGFEIDFNKVHGL